jgi:BirA family biotin operon repressor/biotin-[acetyl-CoA-carboxylase] ligase
MNWKIHHRSETISTNIDALAGVHGDVFTADFQSSGRGRLDHRWLSPSGVNLLMSAVLDVKELEPQQVATLPLAVGFALVKALPREIRGERVMLKWPNDVLIGPRKVAGILCERHGDNVIVGIGINVKAQEFPPEIASRATFLGSPSVEEVRDMVLESLGGCYEKWRTEGFSAFHAELSKIDCLRGRVVSVLKTDDDAAPVKGLCNGITVSGSLDVGGEEVYAGEAHVENVL